MHTSETHAACCRTCQHLGEEDANIGFYACAKLPAWQSVSSRRPACVQYQPQLLTVSDEDQQELF